MRFIALIPMFLGATFGQSGLPREAHGGDVMLAAATRDTSMLSGGMGGSDWTNRGTINVVPLALLSSSGEWKSLPCKPGSGDGCRKFEQEYLKEPHDYTVVSADGRGAQVHAQPTALSECFGYSGPASYTGRGVSRSAVAVGTVTPFANPAVPHILNGREATKLLKALGSLIPGRLDSTTGLRIVRVGLGGADVFVAERSFSEDGSSGAERRKLVFFIGVLDGERFQIVYWKQNTEDEQERLLGTIRMKSGREFLVTVVNDPESYSFRAYEYRGGQVTPVYSGGGESC
jgi:hypothetical protein